MFKAGTSKTVNPAMFIIGLKNNHGWKDYNETFITGTPEIKINVIPNTRPV